MCARVQDTGFLFLSNGASVLLTEDFKAACMRDKISAMLTSIAWASKGRAPCVADRVGSPPHTPRVAPPASPIVEDRPPRPPGRCMRRSCPVVARKRQISQFGWLLGSSVEHHSSQFRGPIHGVAANGLLFGATDNQPSNRSSARRLAANDSSWASGPWR